MKLLFLLLTLSFLFAPMTARGAEWHGSLPEAQRAAAEQGKDVLILCRGEELADHTKSPVALLASPHFRDAADVSYIRVVQDAPQETEQNGDVVHRTYLVFADAQGRPYYCTRPEWAWGMDWLMEEFTIAAERRAVVSALWKEIESRPAEVPEWTYARRLLEAMPVGIELFYAPYQGMIDEAVRNGDNSLPERRAERDRQVALIDELIQEFLGLGSFAEIEAFQREHAEELGQLPIFSQALQMAMASVQNIHDLQLAPYSILSAEGAAPLKQRYLRIVAAEPRTKLARYIRTQGMHLLRAAAAGMLVAPIYKQNPHKALENLDALAAQDSSFHCSQSVNLFRGRVRAELGQWDEALAALRTAHDANPHTDNAKAALKLAQSLVLHRARLEELLPRLRQGDEAVDAEWDGLLSGQYGLDMPFSNGMGLELFYDSPAAADGAAEAEVPAPQADVAPELPAGKTELRYSLHGVETLMPQHSLREIAQAAEQGVEEARQLLEHIHNADISSPFGE